MADAGFLSNRELFSNHYLTRLLPETEAWDQVEEDRLDEAAREIEAIYDDALLSEYNEDQLRNNVLDPVFEVLGLTIETEETLSIEKTDDLIDQIVYELYGLTEEEIEIVEEAVAD